MTAFAMPAIWLSLFAGFALIVVLHELGHYLVGRAVGLRPAVVSLGFGPLVLSYRDGRGTLWTFRSFMVGGYVAFEEDEAAREAGYRNQARLPASLEAARFGPLASVALAGPVANLLLAVALFAAGLTLVPKITIPWVVAETSTGVGASELQAGDVILSVDGCEAAGGSLKALSGCLSPAAEVTYQIRRDGLIEAVRGPHPMRPVIEAVSLGGAAASAGLRPDDVVRSIDGRAVLVWDELVAMVSSSEGRTLSLDVLRGGDLVELQVTPEPHGPGYRIGVLHQPSVVLQEDRLSIGGAFAESIRILSGVVASASYDLPQIFLGRGDRCTLSGPAGVATVAVEAARSGPGFMLMFLGMMSFLMALFNLLPIPGLDGGHVAVGLYRATFGALPGRLVTGALFIGMTTIVLVIMFNAAIADFLC
ncbi:RIP metalloprotease RseP [uncultured Roseobacter sp.]|uniref:RIP metalloprotease RseP n=1 Tax=uncultured Roseobacter sp. TaxID=114847 RepID=UPI002635E2CE|nr:RIP metalloprotease RseP [uncultured Roseobacter sp.]